MPMPKSLSPPWGPRTLHGICLWKSWDRRATRQAVLEAFDEGASIISYIGHGGIQIWADESVLHSSNVGTLSLQSQHGSSTGAFEYLSFARGPSLDAAVAEGVDAAGGLGIRGGHLACRE